MTIAGRLARTFVKAARSKQAAPDVPVPEPRVFSLEDIPGALGSDKEGLRQEFEESLAKEEILRRKARDYARLARQRAADQPGAAADFFRRLLLPIPVSGGEAAWRMPLIAGAGVGGYYGLPYLMGHRRGGAAPLEEVARAMRATVDEPAALETQLAHRLGQANLTAAQETALRRAATEDIAKLVGRAPTRNRVAAALNVLESQGISRADLREAYLRAVPPTAGRGREAVQFFSEAGRLPRWGGAALGLGLGSVLTGLPMAIRAGALRRTGGELAQDARKRMRQAVIQAEREQFRRENVVRALQGETPLPLDEWRSRRKQIKEDWKAALRDYRTMAGERRRGQRMHGISIPVPKEKEAE